MLTLSSLIAATTTGCLALIALGAIRAFRKEDSAREALQESLALGTNQPPTLHPVFDHDLCIGCGSCVDACPEGALGVVDGKAHLIEASACIGHGVCKDACPIPGGISLVFGTAERGVDIPMLREGFQTNVDGIFIIGELGGMGLIRNAMRQGIEAVETIQQVVNESPLVDDPEMVDVLIVGAGPAGIACALKCVEQGLSFTMLDQFSVGGSVAKYPRHKLVMSESVKLPIVGRFGKSEMQKEEIVAGFKEMLETVGVEVLEGRRVTKVKGRPGSFQVRAETTDGKERYKARAIALAIGRRGTPRKLGVPGEEKTHVVYQLTDPEQYKGKRVLVVGGGDSAVEAALSLAKTAGTEVHLSYRKEAFFRIKRKNRQKMEAAGLVAGEGIVQGNLERLKQAVRDDKVILHLGTTVERIGSTKVRLQKAEGSYSYSIEADAVIVSVGGVLPTGFLKSMGIEIETKHGEVDEKSRRKRSTRVRKSATRRSSRKLRMAS